MTAVLVAGAFAGLGLLLLIQVLAPPRVQPGAALARLDAERNEHRLTVLTPGSQRADSALGRRGIQMLSSAGIGLGQVRADLALLGRGLEQHVAASIIGAVVGLVVPMVLAGVGAVLGITVQILVPFLVALGGAALGAALPTLALRSRAQERRRDFRHVVGSFLDLVAMSLAGGRGVPEALQSASELSDGWAMVRIRNALVGARLRGETPWAALGQLGEQLRIIELRDLAAALSLVAEDGAKIRDSLAARADSMRRRELADSEGKAGEKSQSMLVAQLLLCVGFLLFLIYPAMVTVLGGM